MDSLEIENPLLSDDYGRKGLIDDANWKNNKNNASKKIAYPPKAFQTLSFCWVYVILTKVKK